MTPWTRGQGDAGDLAVQEEGADPGRGHQDDERGRQRGHQPGGPSLPGRAGHGGIVSGIPDDATGGHP
ncbi:hypothetical protein ACFQYP_30860 [Nonomuraea antimicrobica]